MGCPWKKYLRWMILSSIERSRCEGWRRTHQRAVAGIGVAVVAAAAGEGEGLVKGGEGEGLVGAVNEGETTRGQEAAAEATTRAAADAAGVADGDVAGVADTRSANAEECLLQVSSYSCSYLIDKHNIDGHQTHIDRQIHSAPMLCKLGHHRPFIAGRCAFKTR